MPKTAVTFSAKVWVYPGVGGWHFVYLPKKEALRISAQHTKKVGFGFIPVTVAVGGTHWKTTLFPSKREGTYLLAIKASIRKKEGIYEGDTIAITLRLA